ncbi:MAG: DegQ family serine endoprotease [Deltaproteobacteria bacterium]|nr:DegQ family serine endoprotease [Deltaproteobacteria bacterium]MBW2017467.1 DegQ family serine endoprotease [Deltaproteobacteria bacterium]MBW2130231.1 DegQ family serine endoprotease [Deltaproteobacteria bacterium]MBW2304823.1 DegQ family serine endoprotease [Deltaproteobacteria bacterium]
MMPAAPGSFSKLVKQASPSVVFISTVKTIKRQPFPLPFGPNDPFRDFFDRFFGDRLPREFKQQALGTGFIIDRDGFILTNNHVVEQTDEIKVKLDNGSEYKARIVGRDPKTDLALIKIKTRDPLTPLPLGDSDKVEVGDWVVAIGNPFGLGHTVTAGIVSAKYRHLGAGAYDNFIQTDASINPGNSGGPLLNTAGEVIGINTAIFSQSGGSIGIGFAIPVNMAKDLLPQLKRGKVIRGWLGVMIQPVTPELKEKLGLREAKGALVADVTPGGPADRAGMKRGDVIVSFNGRDIRESKDLPFLVASTPVNRIVTVEVVRKGEIKRLRVRIGEMPEEGKVSGPLKGPGPRLGMSLEEITPDLARRFGLSETRGLVVTAVQGGTPAAESGIRPGDVILEMDQEPVNSIQEFERRIAAYKKGDTILLLIKRRNTTLFTTIRIPE